MLKQVKKSARKLADFLLQRRDLCNFASWGALAQAAEVATATVFRVLADDEAKPSTSLTSRNQIAASLAFADWWKLLEAWEADDVRRGLPLGEQPKPPSSLAAFNTALTSAASESGIPIEQAERFAALYLKGIADAIRTPRPQQFPGSVIQNNRVRDVTPQEPQESPEPDPTSSAVPSRSSAPHSERERRQPPPSQKHDGHTPRR